MAMVNRQDYFDGAMTMLAESGYGSLRLTSLCKQLGVTSGSFYNWFTGWSDFVDQFLDYWQSEETEALAEEAAKEADPSVRLDTLRTLAAGIPHRAEVALRAWSNTDPRVAAVQRQVDDQRLRVLTTVMLDLGIDAPLADRLGELALSIVIGHEHLDPAAMDWSIGEFIALARLHAASHSPSAAPRD